MQMPPRNIAILLLLLVFALPAYGYLDPISGSLILQALIGGFAGLAVLIKLYWRKLKAKLGFGKPEDGDVPD